VKLARTYSPSDTRVEDAPDPVCGPGEVVCRVLACATCGSDVQDWYVARKLPAVLGHELTGEVVESRADGVEAGTQVVIHHHAPCGGCPVCRSGHETLCPTFRSTALDPGGFAEYVRVERRLVGELLPLDGLDPVPGTLVEPLACALRAQTPAESLLVVGAGASGLLHIAAALGGGYPARVPGDGARAPAVFVTEPRADRLARALEWGAAEYDGSPVQLAVVCTPRADAIAAAVEALGPGGRLCLYAPPGPGEAAVDGNAIFMKELQVSASWSAGPRDMRRALALLRERELPLIEQVFDGLAHTGEALRLQKSGAALKAVVRP
jgi:L-iditol 2-dehydrogenase